VEIAGPIEAVLTARGLKLSERNRAKLAACTDVSILARWNTRAATALSDGDVFAEADGGF
jgi:hypothetical protein